MAYFSNAPKPVFNEKKFPIWGTGLAEIERTILTNIQKRIEALIVEAIREEIGREPKALNLRMVEIRQYAEFAYTNKYAEIYYAGKKLGEIVNKGDEPYPMVRERSLEKLIFIKTKTNERKESI